MGIGIALAKVAEVAGGAMAGIGASITTEGFIMEQGFKYCSTKFGKACVMCTAWAVGSAAGTKVSEMFVEEVENLVECYEKIKDGLTVNFSVSKGEADGEGA